MGYAGLHSNLEKNHTKMIVIIVICLLQLQKKSPAFLRNFERNVFLWIVQMVIKDFFGQTKNKKPSGSTRDIFSQSAAKSKQEILPKTLFAKSEQLRLMGSVSKLVQSFLVSFHIFHGKKEKHLPRSLPSQKNLPRTQELKGSRLHFYH